MRTTIVSFIFLSLLLVCGEAGAGDTGKDKSKMHFERAVQFYKQGKYQDALIDFQAAYDYRPHWQIKYNLAMCHYYLQSYVQAAKEIAQFYKEGKGNIDLDQLKSAQGILTEIRKKIAVLVVTGDFEGGEAVVAVDAEAWDDLEPGEEMFLEPGRHHVTVTFRETTIIDKDVTFEPGSSKEIFASTATSEQAEDVDMDAGEGAAVDDRPVSPEPEDEPPVTSRKPTSRKKAAAWATLAIGAAFLAAGCVTAGLGTAKKQDMERLENEYMEKYNDSLTTVSELEAILAARDDKYEASSGFYAATYALLAAGGALAVVSITLFVLSRKDGRDEAQSAFIHAGPGALQLEILF